MLRACRRTAAPPTSTTAPPPIKTARRCMALYIVLRSRPSLGNSPASTRDFYVVARRALAVEQLREFAPRQRCANGSAVSAPRVRNHALRADSNLGNVSAQRHASTRAVESKTPAPAPDIGSRAPLGACADALTSRHDLVFCFRSPSKMSLESAFLARREDSRRPELVAEPEQRRQGRRGQRDIRRNSEAGHSVARRPGSDGRAGRRTQRMERETLASLEASPGIDRAK